MPLSQKQQDAYATRGSCGHELHPRTTRNGKSHTITALMLSALVMEKSVHWSVTKTAIDVVRLSYATYWARSSRYTLGMMHQKRDRTKRRINDLLDQIGHGYAEQLSTHKTKEGRAKVDTLGTLDRLHIERKIAENSSRQGEYRL